MKKIQSFMFLLSSDRSGSNLLLRIMNSHPLVFAPAPLHVFPVLNKVIENYGDLSINTNWYALLNNTCELINAEFGEFKTGFSEINKNTTEKSLNGLIKSIYSIEAKKNNKSNIFIKLHDAYNYFNFLSEYFPSAKYIHLVRDPRDMSLSWLNATGLKGGIMRAAKIWREDQRGYEQLSNKITKEQFLQVHYEQLLKNPRTTLKTICAFLEIPFSDSMLNYYQSEHSIKLASKIQAWANLSQPILKSNYNNYKKGLLAPQIEYIELICQKHMLKYGYDFELLNKQTNLEMLENLLEKNEPWLKEAYSQLPSDERKAHKKFQMAIQKCNAFNSAN